MTAHDVLALRLTLLRGGYLPIPLYGKVPPAYGKNNKRKGLADGRSSKMFRTNKLKCGAAPGPTRSTPAS